MHHYLDVLGNVAYSADTCVQELRERPVIGNRAVGEEYSAPYFIADLHHIGQGVVL